VSRKTDSVKNSLSSFVTAYNAVVDEVDKNRGQASGALAGQSIVYTTGQALSDLQGYAPGSGPFSSLADLGLSIDKDGHLNFDSSTFDQAANGHIDDVMTFLGGATSGGFLKSATDTINQLEDPNDGQVQNAISAINSQIANQNDRISEEQDRIDTLQESLNEQMAAADAMIASLEQQATYMTNLFQAMFPSNSSNQ
jgi:flagellar hook-associated protein 2